MSVLRGENRPQQRCSALLQEQRASRGPGRKSSVHKTVRNCVVNLKRKNLCDYSLPQDRDLQRIHCDVGSPIQSEYIQSADADHSKQARTPAAQQFYNYVGSSERNGEYLMTNPDQSHD